MRVPCMPVPGNLNYILILYITVPVLNIIHYTVLLVLLYSYPYILVF